MTHYAPCTLALLLGLSSAAGGARPVDDAPAQRSDAVMLELPLDNGRIAVRDVLEQLLRAAGIDPGERLNGVEWTIDVGSFLGRLQLDVVEQLLPGTIEIEVLEDRVAIEIRTEQLQAQGRLLLERIEGWMLEAAGAEARGSFGMTVVTRADPRAPLEVLPAGTTRAVILIHGLDDPGWMWRDLAPRLIDSGHIVLRFEYPNDQPIADSADLLATHLQRLRESGIRNVDIVAHSMGGLASRDVLTRKAYYGGCGSGGGRFPAVGRLIMLGTPNHGTPVARLRGVAELREQISRWVSGDGTLADSLRDGAGEAAYDLLPGSDFLRRLNARAHPTHTRYTIVAGRISPVSQQEIDELAETWQRIAGADGGGDSFGSDRVARLLKAMIRSLGDGIVSTESARLEGVEDIIFVEANHLGMIVNVFPSDDVPPAIPMVLDRLRDGG